MCWKKPADGLSLDQNLPHMTTVSRRHMFVDLHKWIYVYDTTQSIYFLSMHVNMKISQHEMLEICLIG